jgi:MFS family permease
MVGRLSDRRGVRVPVQYGLAAGVLGSLILVLELAPVPYALLIIATSAIYGILFTPAFALIADGADRVGLAQGMAFGMMNAAWAVGAMAGPAGAGALAGATGEEIPFLLAALTCAGALAIVLLRPRVSPAGAPAEI